LFSDDCHLYVCRRRGFGDSAIINFLGQPAVAGMPEIEASKYVSLYWGGMLIGRFMGAVELSEMKKVNKQISLVVIPLLAYLLLWVAQSAPLDAMRGGSDAHVFQLWKEKFVQNWGMFGTYLPFLAVCWALFQFGKSLAGRTLMIFSSTVVVLLVTAILVGGKTAVVRGRWDYSLPSVGRTRSPAIEGTGIYESQASSLLVMAILGGGSCHPSRGWWRFDKNLRSLHSAADSLRLRRFTAPKVIASTAAMQAQPFASNPQPARRRRRGRPRIVDGELALPGLYVTIRTIRLQLRHKPSQ
jgi:fucose permease